MLAGLGDGLVVETSSCWSNWRVGCQKACGRPRPLMKMSQIVFGVEGLLCSCVKVYDIGHVGLVGSKMCCRPGI